MLSSVGMENFRGFDRYRLGGLARVNLLVGENNSGKSSLLEALAFLATGGDLQTLIACVQQRGELAYSEIYETSMPDVRHFFCGHCADSGGELALWADDEGLRLVLDENVSAGVEAVYPNARRVGWTSDVPMGAVLFASGGVNGPEGIAVPLIENGAIHNSVFFHYVNAIRAERRKRPQTGYLLPTSIVSDEIGKYWDQAVIAGREGEVISALRIIEPRLRNLFLLSRTRNGDQRGAAAGMLLELEGERARVPLGSVGDGSRRFLALALALTRCDNGVLLVDEVDTGLHYSVMSKLWRLIVETACRTNMQAFVTTHNSDCVRGLAQFCREHPEMREEVSVQKINCELRESVPLHADEIMLADEQHMEVR